MVAVGLIAEYNPLHAGHIRQLRAAADLPDVDTTIVVMSEYATQRGDLAIADAYTRAHIAVLCGADLVIGLPYPYSAAPAQFFASAGIEILNALGAKFLHFGSECGNISALQRASDFLFSEDFLLRLTAWRQAHPAQGLLEAQSACYLTAQGESLPGGSNDHLAMAYLYALKQTNSAMRPVTIKRDGQAYLDESHPVSDISPSAAALRDLWKTQGFDALEQLLPAPCHTLLKEQVKAGYTVLSSPIADALLLTNLRTHTPVELSDYAGMAGGVAERLCQNAHQASTLQELLSLTATRAYTNARLRRAILASFCHVTENDWHSPIPYVRVLAANERGRAYLSSIRKSCPLPCLTKPSKIPDNAPAKRQAEAEKRLLALFAAASETPRSLACFYQLSPTMITKAPSN